MNNEKQLKCDLLSIISIATDLLKDFEYHAVEVLPSDVDAVSAVLAQLRKINISQDIPF